MSVQIEAVIKHELTVEQIVALPSLLAGSSYNEFEGLWAWYDPDTNAKFIEWLWDLSMDEYLEHVSAKAAFISRGQFFISFNNRDTICFTGPNIGLFESNPSVRKEFKKSAENLNALIKGKELFYVSYDLIDAYVTERYIPDIDSFDNFKAYLQLHNYHFYQDS